jgi:rhodanese-related sulfurtransferase
VRDEATYKAGHIKGAKSIPLPQFNERIGELPKDKLIITYCA